MNSRQRVEAALNHQQPDHVPLDLGGSAVTGMHVSSVYKLRQALKLDPPGTPVKVVEAVPDARRNRPRPAGRPGRGRGRPRRGRSRSSASEYEDWKPWTTFDGTPVLVPGGFNTQPEPNGDILMYPEGDRSAPAQRPDAQGRVLFRHDRPPGADRRREAERRGQPGGVRPDLRRACCSTSPARPTGCGARAIGRFWPTSAARPSATSPWCPPPG